MCISAAGLAIGSGLGPGSGPAVAARFLCPTVYTSDEGMAEWMHAHGVPGAAPDGPGAPKPKFMLDIEAPLFQRSCGF